MGYCKDKDGYEDAGICKPKGKLVREKEDPDANIHRIYRCPDCGREWQDIFLYDGMYDMEGEPL